MQKAMLDGRCAAAALLSAVLTGCGSLDLGDALDAAAVASEASEISACRDQYARTGDVFRLSDCEAEAVGR